MVDHCALAFHHHVQPAIPEARLLSRPAQQLGSQLAVIAPALVAMTGPRHPHQLAGVALTGSELHRQAPHLCPPLYEPREFFRITDCNMSLSRLRSATSFFSRAFSSRNCFISCASLTDMPPYFAFQA